MKRWAAAGLLTAALATPAAAGDGAIGTWVRRADDPNREVWNVGMVKMVIEPWSDSGWKITYVLDDGKGGTVLATVETRLEGEDAPLLIAGKPSGNTMAIRRLDDRHSSCELKLNGKPYGTSRGELSADGRSIRVDNEITATAGDHAPGRYTEYWDRQ